MKKTCRAQRAHGLHATARKMGRRIADLAANGSVVTDADLLTDFTTTALAKHGPAARAHARALLGMKHPTPVDRKPSIAKLPGVRLVLTDEPEKGDGLSESLVKEVTGGEPMETRKLHGVRVNFIEGPVTNHRPAITEQDVGIWRRVEPLQAVEEWKG
ncbi:hypothetical protein D3877_12805 [Azospirillum cavernae]|uniref:Uncharacterized protein n=1 Tax=Azospirillum cavernae TaxID=2320860 RepID=A0A418VVA0_9PROT|nr:hypothetical protein [Azospirillum cavernae]RJF81098.1 hypothetical protein D3877_12805 [Azospirillum cavernae]